MDRGGFSPTRSRARDSGWTRSHSTLWRERTTQARTCACRRSLSGCALRSSVKARTRNVKGEVCLKTVPYMMREVRHFEEIHHRGAEQLLWDSNSVSLYKIYAYPKDGKIMSPCSRGARWSLPQARVRAACDCQCSLNSRSAERRAE